jgi:3-methyladenine DNA glycosylase/8-oxoguanine DNA glycosylase
MKLAELENLPELDLIKQAQAVGLGKRAYSLAPHELAKEILVRIGEYANEDAWKASAVLARIDRLERNLGSLREELSNLLHRLDTQASKAMYLAEASLMCGSYHRAPTPEEIAAMSDDALRHLCAGLNLPRDLSKARMLDEISKKLEWNKWHEQSES